MREPVQDITVLSENSMLAGNSNVEASLMRLPRKSFVLCYCVAASRYSGNKVLTDTPKYTHLHTYAHAHTQAAPSDLGYALPLSAHQIRIQHYDEYGCHRVS